MKQLITGMALWLGLMAGVQAAPFSISADGQEVTDSKTGLVWRRCAEGMNWSGSTCTGTALTFTLNEVLERARMGAWGGWRLPNIKELRSIVDKTRYYPAIDPQAFPATPSQFFWSSSAYAGNAGGAWLVHFGSGGFAFYDVSRSYDVSAVRLVRAGQ